MWSRLSMIRDFRPSSLLPRSAKTHPLMPAPTMIMSYSSASPLSPANQLGSWSLPRRTLRSMPAHSSLPRVVISD